MKSEDNKNVFVANVNKLLERKLGQIGAILHGDCVSMGNINCLLCLIVTKCVDIRHQPSLTISSALPVSALIW